mgnify:CR=1 FL=1
MFNGRTYDRQSDRTVARQIIKKEAFRLPALLNSYLPKGFIAAIFFERFADC